MNRDFKGVWIPKHIWLDETLTWMQKLLLVEIDSLDNADHCFASNAHFAKHLQLSKSRVSDLVGQLDKLGYIKCFFEYKGKECVKRTISLTSKRVVSIPNTPLRDSEDPPSGNGEGTNTSLNINIKRFAVPTLEQIEAYKAEKNFQCCAEKFIDYQSAKGWVVGRSPMKCWKSAFRTWEKNHHEFKKQRETSNVKRSGSGSANPNWLDIDAGF